MQDSDSKILDAGGKPLAGGIATEDPNKKTLGPGVEAKIPDSGKKKESALPPEPKKVIVVLLHPDGEFEMKSTLSEPMIVYVLERLKFYVITGQIKKPTSRIIDPRGAHGLRGALHAFRGKFRKNGN